MIIGERINATNKGVAEAIEKRDSIFIQQLASAQVAAGADYIDVNAKAETLEQEVSDMEWLVDVIQEATDKPLVIDSAEPKVIEIGMRRCQDRKLMVNSVTAASLKLEKIASLVVGSNAGVIALAMDENGIPDSIEGRINACDSIIEKLTAYGLPLQRIFFDPIVLPIGVDSKQGMVTLNTLQGIKSKYPEARTTLGLSNISYGLPNRKAINRCFLLMAMCAGLDSAIIDPLDSKLMSYIKVGKMLKGEDPFCKEYLTAHRKGAFREG